MRRALASVLLMACFCARIMGQDPDTDFRLCDGMPSSQTAFAMALGGELQDAAVRTLGSGGLSAADIRRILFVLFTPTPSSLLQLNGRVDQTVTPVTLANDLRGRFNQIVASKISSVRRDDVACSISLLSYREAADVFGKRVANQYGVVQVTVRNNNSEHEFLLHQLDFWFGDTLQYYATRDRKIARGVAEKGQVIDPRNLTFRVLEGLGSVMGATWPALSNDARLGTNVFNTAFLPAIKMVVPDLTVPQISKLDDMGFSAGASTMLIPKSGAISLVTFIPSDSFVVPKLAQYQRMIKTAGNETGQIKRCADLRQQIIALGTQSSRDQDTDAKKQELARQKADIDSRIAPCVADEQLRDQPLVPSMSVDTARMAKGTTQGRSRLMPFAKRNKNIGDFDPAVVMLLQKDLHILVSGSHIEQITTQMAITSVDCSAPTLAFKGTNVDCKLTGKNLDLLVKARLIGAKESTFSVESNGIQQTKDDTSHLGFTFDPCLVAGRSDGEFMIEVTTSRGGAQTLTLAKPLSMTTPVLTCSKQATGLQFELSGAAGLKATALSIQPMSGGASTDLTLKDGTYTPARNEVPAGPYTVTATVDGKAAVLCSPVSVP